MSAAELEAARAQLTATCRQISQRGLAGSLTSGNASLRIGGRLLVTPSAVGFDEITEGSLVLVEAADGTPAGGARPDEPGENEPLKPTTELALHLSAHAAADGAVRCVLHLHAPWMVAAGCMELAELPLVHYHQALLGEEPTPVVSYATPGSPELALAAGQALGVSSRAALLASHGAVVMGESGEEALAHAEVLEDICRIVVLTRGNSRSMTRGELADARTLFESYGPSGD